MPRTLQHRAVAGALPLSTRPLPSLGRLAPARPEVAPTREAFGRARHGAWAKILRMTSKDVIHMPGYNEWLHYVSPTKLD